jgi:hypothetical protein
VMNVVTIALCSDGKEFYSMLDLIFNHQPALVGSGSAIRAAVVGFAVAPTQETDSHVFHLM